MQGWSNDDVRRMRAFPLRVSTLACVVLSLSAVLGQTTPVRAAPDSHLPEILAYIHNGWDSLTRSTSSCSGISDPKLSGAPLLYLPAGFNEPIEVEKMQRECGVKVAYLPQVIDKAGTAESDLIDPPGLLYLQNKYVVPGGRFNEMYGWDSYFIIRGLLRDGRVGLARGMVENFFFEIEHYGAVLNANRTYYLTRSQPPFLSSMVVAVHEAQKAKGQNDQAWLEKAYSYVKRDHDMWTRDPHLAGSTGLSRYYDFGDGPAMEALQDENDIYRQVAAYFVVHPAVPPLHAEESDVSPGRPSGQAYSVRVCSAGASQSSCEPARLIKLKPDYYKGDRSMRESGFDISFRFGPYGAATLHESQGQWDYPFGWAPIQLLAVEGMRRYGYNTEADRVSAEFLSTVLQNFVRDRTIREKYNVVTRSSETQVRAGYSANVVGFGWTNATFLELLNSIPPEKVGHLAQGLSAAGAQQ